MAQQFDGVVARAFPTRIPDGTRTQMSRRLGADGSVYVQAMGAAKTHLYADEGTYFLATNPTPGTGLATIAAQASLADTAPFVLIKNGNPAGGKRIYMDQLVLIATAAGTGGTAIHFAAKIDAAAGGARYTSGGSQITPVNTNGDDGTVSQATVYAGAIVAAAAGNPRLLSHRLVRPVIPVVGDTYVFNFGGAGSGVGGLVPSGTAISQQNFDVSPMIIGPGEWGQLHIWLPSQTVASSFEVELGYIER